MNHQERDIWLIKLKPFKILLFANASLDKTLI